MPSDAQDLSVVLQSQQKRDLAPNISSQVTNELKDSLIFQCDWAELLQSAPTALSSLGACFIASSSPKATVSLTPPPEKGFQYLKYTSLQANLIECGNLGRLAFIEAEAGMGKIQLTSKIISSKVNDVIALLADPPSAKKILKPQLSTVKSAAGTCFDTAVDIDKKFEDWLMYACEMHAACVAQENTTRDSMLSNSICLAAEETRLDYQKGAVEAAEAASKLLAKQVQLAGDTFKKASDEFPTGWDLMGQQIVGDVANCLTTALTQAIPVLINNLTPMAKLKTGTDIVGGFVHPQNNSNGVPPIHGADGVSGATAATPSPTGMPSVVPPAAADPAYADVLKSTTYLAGLNSIVHGKTGDIDWDLAKGDGSASKAKSTARFFATVLGDAKTRFTDLATDEEPSVALTTILDVTTRIATELDTVVDNFSEAKQELPAKHSPEVKQWQADFATQYKKATKLAAFALSLPGGVGQGIPLMTTDPALQTAQINAKSAQGQALLEAAKNRLSTTEDMLVKSQDTYVKATQLLVDQKTKLAEIQANLTRLAASSLSLAEIRSILIESIKMVISLKQQISSLVRFFKGMSAVIEICIKLHVEPFLETVKALVAADGTDPNKDLKVGEFTLTDLQRSQCYSAVILMRAYFSVFADIAKMWVQMSHQCVMPGLALCDDLSVTVDDPAQLKRKLQQLQAWSSSATQTVASTASQKQKEIVDGMDSRISDIKDTTTRIEAPPESVLEAINAGTTATAHAAQSALEQKSQQSTLNRFLITGDDS